MGMEFFKNKEKQKEDNLFEEKEKMPMNVQDLIDNLIQTEKNRKEMFKNGITEYGENPPVIQVNGKTVLRIEMKGDIVNIVSE